MADQAGTNTTRFCRHCGAPIYNGEADCHYCGGDSRHTPWARIVLAIGAMALLVAGLTRLF